MLETVDLEKKTIIFCGQFETPFGRKTADFSL